MNEICNKKAVVFAIATILILVSSVQGINSVGVEPVTDDSVNVNEGISLLDLDATIDNENYIINVVQPQPTNILAGTITIYVNTSAIDGRGDLNASQKTALKQHILDHIKSNFEGALGSGNVTVTDDPSQQGGADRNVSIEPGMSDPPGSAWGQCHGGNNTVKVFLGEFMNDSSVNGSFQNPDGSWNITKLGNAIGHTAGHEVAHTYSVGHNHEERPKPPDFLPPDENDNRSKMTAGENINATERANMRFDLDNHTIDVIGNNLGKDACVAFPDYDMKVLLAHYFGPTTLPDKPDEAGSLDVTFDFYTEMPGHFELGFLGEDTDDGLYDGNSEFDFIYKTSLSNDENIDAKILTFISEFHDHTTWLLRGSEGSSHPGEWFMLDEKNVTLSDFIETPEGDIVARKVAMSWPYQGVYVSFDALSFGEASNPYNGFTYDFVQPPWEHKMHFPQLPDEDGWDVYATAGLTQPEYPQVCLADDWNCTETGPVSDIHFWGSWIGDNIGEIANFTIAIHADIPADENPDGYSKPGTCLWERIFYPSEWTEIRISSPYMQGWYDPSAGYYIENDHSTYYQYDIVNIAEPFIQEKGTIYWLSISASVEEVVALQPLWGWKSTEDHWNDDAVWAYWGELKWIDIYEPSPPPITNEFDVALTPMGGFAWGGGTDYYDDGTSHNGWYYYPYTEWWNIWFYDHPFDSTRYKQIAISFDLFIYDDSEPAWIEVAVNWATDLWASRLPPPIPPIENEELYIGRETLFTTEFPKGHHDFTFVIPDYNPEWVSVDVRGWNFVIEGIITHDCLPKIEQSLDLAFVITSEEPCVPSIDVEKYVWDETLGEWVDADAEADAIDIPTGTNAEFLITVHNNGTCCNLTDIYVYDFMDDSMEFVDAVPYPDEVITIPGQGTELVWYNLGSLSPCNWINITVIARVVGPHCSIDENHIYADGYCKENGELVWDEDSAFIHATEEGEWYWKPAYPNYAPSGMPDFDQKQDMWKAIHDGGNGIAETTASGDDRQVVVSGSTVTPYGVVVAPGPNCQLDTQPGGDDIAKWAFCGPTAVANCLWWFDSKYADPDGYPDDGEDTFPLVQDYSVVGVGDDHSSSNVPYLIEDLASRMHTCENGTTDIHDMEDAVDQWFIDTGLDNMFEENTYNEPTFEFIESEIERSQDVILLLGYYDVEGGEDIDQHQEICEQCEHVGPVYWISWQEFMPTASSLSRVEVKIARTEGYPNNVPITMTIESPLGVVLTSKTLNWWEVLEEPWCTTNWISFDVPDIAITPGQSYYIVLTTVGLAYHWCGVNWDAYLPGLSNFGPDWDWTFRTFCEYGECVRKGGHYVTCAGVNSDAFKIAFSDPRWDISNPSANDHNNAQNVSHDIYGVLIGSPCPGLPYQWWLPDYPAEHDYTIVEQAVVICPKPSVEINKWVWDGLEWVDEIDADVGETVSFKIEVHNNGGYDLTNIQVVDTLPFCLDYVAGSAVPIPTSVDGKIITWNLLGPLSYCNTITITFDADVVSVGENTNNVDVTADAYPYPEDPVPVTVSDSDIAIVYATEPCVPSVDVEKYVWDDTLGEWVDADDEADAIDIPTGTNAEFLITVYNDGTCCDLTDIYVYDLMNDSMEFVSADPYPDEIVSVQGGTELYWYSLGTLSTGETIDIMIFARVVGPVCSFDENYVYADGYCKENGELVWDEDSAYVHAIEPCVPSIDVEKYVWDENLRDWVDADTAEDALDLPVGADVEYLIAIHNDGECCELDITVYDFLEDSMEYVSANPTPTFVDPTVPGGTEILWFDLGPLSPCNWINITVQATVLGPACNTDYNYALVEAYCESTEEYVRDEDYAYVHAVEPSVPSVDIEKYVWDETLGDWVDYIEVGIGTIVRFNLSIHNTDLVTFIVTKVWDILPPCLEYADNATVNGMLWEPDVTTPPIYEWNYPLPAGYWYPDSEPGELPPGEWIYIEFDAIATILGENINEACVEANNGAGGPVTDCSSATVFVNPGGIPPEITNVTMITSDPLDTDSPYGWENITVTVRDPVYGIKMHYPQMPDLFGWDVLATFPVVLADDWMCTGTGPVTDIHFWGSWFHNGVGTIRGFQISIHEDIPDPDGQGPLYSMPGKELWAQYITDFNMVIMEPSPQGWYDPFYQQWEYPDHDLYFQYDIVVISNPFIQEEGVIYWLDISADVIGSDYLQPPPLWGWKTSMDHWNDDAVWTLSGEYHWIDMYEPPEFTTSLDLAFVIAGEYDEVDEVELNVINDTTTVGYPMTKIPGTDTYYCNITITPHGVYTYHVWADDIGGNNATSTDEPFELPPNWDVSMNGETYIEDFVLVAGWYGVTGPNGGWIREDVSNNGEVYIEDFVIIAGHYGERWKPI